ncbi:MAG: esterase-like activity of phytase family protein [Gammaproteobacteria bacterium]|nr:esterase-like activity of phytase family protein [Gammaproteobacteria bacterium]
MRIHNPRSLARSWLPLLLLSQTVAVAQAATLTGFAVLPADTFTPGPSSGQFIQPVNGRQPPFHEQQPIQGFSAVIKGDNGTFLVLSDNGFGRRDNSADYLLSIYEISVDFRTAAGGAGTIDIETVMHLGDPDSHMDYAIARVTDRQLTGADLDPESFRRAADGSFWVGEEFNPSLVQFSRQGELLAPPFRLKGLSAADNPVDEEATLPRSRGFEGMAQSIDGRRLYPMLEGEMLGPEPGLNIYTFDIAERRFLNSHAGDASYRYRLDPGATAIGDFTLYSATGGLVIERDSAEGDQARIKKIYRVDFEKLDENGFLAKTMLADLLDINDPDDLDRDGRQVFSFPFWTIEGLVVLDSTTLGIVNDNNYPLGQARDTTGTRPDNTEFILLRIDPLWAE